MSATSDEDRLAAALREAIAVDRGRVRAPLVQGVLKRSRRRRRQRVAVITALAVAVLGTGAGVVRIAGGSDPDVVRVAAPSPAASPLGLTVLDKGQDASGAWRITAQTEGEVCIRYEDRYTESGSCGLASPEDLRETSMFPVVDGGRAATVVAGLAPEDASRVVLTTDEGTVTADLTDVGDERFFDARVPPGLPVTLLSAQRDDGVVVATARDLPPPPEQVTGSTASPVPPDVVPGQDPLPPPPEPAAVIAVLRAFAAEPQSELPTVPFATTVQLGLGPTVVRTVRQAELADPAVWSLPGPYAASSAAQRFSALDLLRDEGPYEVGAGPHKHCASPPRPAPPGLEDALRVWVQPEDTSCLAWYTVDVFLRDQVIVAVTLDVWEP